MLLCCRMYLCVYAGLGCVSLCLPGVWHHLCAKAVLSKQLQHNSMRYAERALSICTFSCLFVRCKSKSSIGTKACCSCMMLECVCSQAMICNGKVCALWCRHRVQVSQDVAVQCIIRRVRSCCYKSVLCRMHKDRHKERRRCCDCNLLC